MKFDWDEKKNRLNIAKHGVSFDTACRIFDGFTVDRTDDREAYGETREISIGIVGGITFITVVHADRKGVCRIISARPSVRSERKTYETALQKTFNA